MRAVVGENQPWRQRIESRYFAWPRGEDNAVLRLARERMLCGRPDGRCSTAAQQQGLLQIVNDFCNRTNALCDGCRLPDLLASRADAADDAPDDAPGAINP
jgi:hypothetical protein